ncbi:SET and MYND domain-containing protein DDB_G0292454 [Hondaea fermentalgiana]|uniref:SET and MYND domain-containing protein DDB_G0292454 n=1 Tax=Hondaea fermentalgiana TaxID=2315210 RepID=A0A2R5GR50_9STRA|nr:SET and MYND domain-containing protein DDB_G0292454 [Hondaea fermentalgiana]|eukprot:GBG33352.1 SET and MYND domain-containing protein DDB_G0292454 [Hondaea fermentalgiana]
MSGVQGLSLELLSQLACPSVLTIKEVAKVGGGRGLFVQIPFKKGAPIGPLPPLGAAPVSPDLLAQAARRAPRWTPRLAADVAGESEENKPQVFTHRPRKAGANSKNKNKGKKRRTFHADARADVRAEVCPSCFAKDTRLQCVYCNGTNSQVTHLEQTLHNALRVLHDENARAGVLGGTEPNRFPVIAQSILLRCIVEEWVMEIGNCATLMYALMRPELGKGAETAWEADWEKARTTLEAVCARARIPLDLSPLWSAEPEDHDFGGAKALYMQCMSVLHVNSLRSPETSALYPTLSFANHSCDPSVDLSFDGAMAYLVPRRDLASGDELTFHYAGSRGLNQDQLQKFLSWNYGFKCKVDCGCSVRDDPANVGATH